MSKPEYLEEFSEEEMALGMKFLAAIKWMFTLLNFVVIALTIYASYVGVNIGLTLTGFIVGSFVCRFGKTYFRNLIDDVSADIEQVEAVALLVDKPQTFAKNDNIANIQKLSPRTLVLASLALGLVGLFWYGVGFGLRSLG